MENGTLEPSSLPEKPNGNHSQHANNGNGNSGSNSNLVQTTCTSSTATSASVSISNNATSSSVATVKCNGSLLLPPPQQQQQQLKEGSKRNGGFAHSSCQTEKSQLLLSCASVNNGGLISASELSQTFYASSAVALKENGLIETAL